jgi:tRNA threonylcarbamoyladenosine biosynthesis protein TsaE
MQIISKSLEETRAVAQSVLDDLIQAEHASVLSLSGDLGSGKTAFSQVVGNVLGVEETMQSPTFVIMKIYKIDFKGFKNLIHIDAYRLEKESELLHLGWEEIIKEKENLVLIEWPEMVQSIIPNTAHKIDFKFIDEDTREINYEN